MRTLLLRSMNNFKNIDFVIIMGIVSLAMLFSCSESKQDEFTVTKDVKIGAFSQTLADAGSKIFSEKCASCHKMDEKLVGPPLRNIVKHRSVDYIFSQILHPDKMIASNDTVKALLSQYLTSMPNQHLSMPDAKAVYEYLRQEAGVK